MNINIPITTDSENMIKDIFNRYEESDKIPKILEGRTIIHMYPTEDTIDDYGEAHGFRDSLIFIFDIYNCNTGKVYRRKGYYDEIDLTVPCRIRFFKDLSTMLIIDDRIFIGNTQSVMICPYE